MSIRVLSVISRMNVGGPAVLLSPLFNELVGPEFEHLLVTGKCPPNEVDYLDSHPLVTNVQYIKEVSRNIGPVGDLIGFLKLCRIIRKFEPDIVHTHTSKAGLLGRVAAFFSYPKAIRMHSFHGHVLSGYFNRPMEILFRTLEKIAGYITDVALSDSAPVANELKSLGVCRETDWIVINPGVAKIESNLQNKSNKQHKYFVIGWIGRFAAIKNPSLAVKVFGKLENQFPGRFRFIMAGAGELFEAAKTLSAELAVPIEFLGWLTSTSEFFAEVNLLLVTSINEGFGMIILEAAQFGVPTISTNVGGISDFIQDNKSGFFADPDVDAFVKVVSEIYENDDLRNMVGNYAKSLVSQQFTSERFIDTHLDLYRRVLSETK